MIIPPPAELVLDGFTMRPWSVKDLDPYSAALAASEDHLRPWTPWVLDGRVPGQSIEDRLAMHAARFVAGEEWVYGLFADDGREVLGGCGLYPRVGPGGIEVGYWLAVAHTGRGLATRAAGVLTAEAFNSPDIEHVEIRCERRNVASARVPERLGFVREEVMGAGGGEELVTWRLSREVFLRSRARRHI